MSWNSLSIPIKMLVIILAAVIAMLFFGRIKPIEYVLESEPVQRIIFSLPVQSQSTVLSKIKSYAEEQKFKTEIRKGPNEHEAALIFEGRGQRWEIANPFDDATEYHVYAYLVGNAIENNGDLEVIEVKVVQIFLENGATELSTAQ